MYKKVIILTKISILCKHKNNIVQIQFYGEDRGENKAHKKFTNYRSLTISSFPLPKNILQFKCVLNCSQIIEPEN